MTPLSPEAEEPLQILQVISIEFAESFQKFAEQIQPIALQVHDQIQTFAEALQSETFRRRLHVLQTINDIQLDLHPYGDADLADVVNALIDAKPCEYKEILDACFLKRQPQKGRGISLKKSINFICDIINLYAALTSLGVLPDPLTVWANLFEGPEQNIHATVNQTPESIVSQEDCSCTRHENIEEDPISYVPAQLVWQFQTLSKQKACSTTDISLYFL